MLGCSGLFLCISPRFSWATAMLYSPGMWQAFVKSILIHGSALQVGFSLSAEYVKGF